MFYETLFTTHDTWMLLAIMCGWVALSIYLEHTYAWAAKISGAVLALLGALLFTNLKIIPSNAPIFDDFVWGFAVPMAIPLLLMRCNIRKIWKESGRILIIFLIGAFGTIVGAFLAVFLLKDLIPGIAGIAGMMTGSYIGGSLNLAILADSFQVPEGMVAATTVADNLLMVLYFFVLITIPIIGFFRRAFRHPHIDEVEQTEISTHAKTQAEAYWGRNPISIKDIAFNMALTVIIVAFSTKLASSISVWVPTGNPVLNFINGLFGNKYMIITTVAMLIATFKSEQVAKINGSQEIGTYFIYLFFFAIGVPASIQQIIFEAPAILLLCLIMVVVNMIFCFVFGKLLKLNLEDILLASNANIGGPTTAAAMAISKGWTRLVGPIMLVGTVGYVIGTYFGLFVGQLLG